MATDLCALGIDQHIIYCSKTFHDSKRKQHIKVEMCICGWENGGLYHRKEMLPNGYLCFLFVNVNNGQQWTWCFQRENKSQLWEAGTLSYFSQNMEDNLKMFPWLGRQTVHGGLHCKRRAKCKGLRYFQLAIQYYQFNEDWNFHLWGINSFLLALLRPYIMYNSENNVNHLTTHSQISCSKTMFCFSHILFLCTP